MGRIRVSCQIKAPLTDVYTLYTDVYRLPQWWLGVHSISCMTGRPGQPGAKYTVHLGPWRRSECRVTRVEPLRLHERIWSRIPFVPEVLTATFNPTPAGTTVDYEIHYDIPLGPVGRVIDRLWVSSLMAHRVKAELSNFKVLAEQG